MRRPGSGAGEPDSVRARIYEVVSRIPKGKVATYGQVATLAGMRGHARQVGYALHDLREGSNVPWHRVINARGEFMVPSLSWSRFGSLHFEVDGSITSPQRRGKTLRIWYTGHCPIRWRARPALWE